VRDPYEFRHPEPGAVLGSFPHSSPASRPGSPRFALLGSFRKYLRSSAFICGKNGLGFVPPGVTITRPPHSTVGSFRYLCSSVFICGQMVLDSSQNTFATFCRRIGFVSRIFILRCGSSPVHPFIYAPTRHASSTILRNPYNQSHLTTRQESPRIPARAPHPPVTAPAQPLPKFDNTSLPFLSWNFSHPFGAITLAPCIAAQMQTVSSVWSGI
jgi:hypothetical protein